MATKNHIHVMVNGQNIETRPCRHCGTGPNGPKLHLITELRFITGGWYCQTHAVKKIECLKRERRLAS